MNKPWVVDQPGDMVVSIDQHGRGRVQNSGLGQSAEGTDLFAYLSGQPQPEKPWQPTKDEYLKVEQAVCDMIAKVYDLERMLAGLAFLFALSWAIYLVAHFLF